MTEVKTQQSEQEANTTSFKILPTTYILSPLTCFSKKRLFEELCAVAAAVTGIKSSIFLRALNEREWAGSTICAEGVGMPHAMVPELKQSLAVLAILQDKVAYNAVDSDYAGVDVAFAFFISPKDKYATVADNLRLVSQELENSDFIKALKRSWQDNSKLLSILAKIDQLLSEQVKQPEAERAESPSTASSIMQFISDAITSIGGDREDEEESKERKEAKEAKELKELKAREAAAALATSATAASASASAPAVAAAVSSVAAAAVARSPNTAVSTMASTTDASIAQEVLASADFAAAQRSAIASAKTPEAVTPNTSATSSIMQFISEAIGTIGGMGDKESQGSAAHAQNQAYAQASGAMSPQGFGRQGEPLAARGMPSAAMAAQMDAGAASYNDKQAKPAIAGQRFAWDHSSKPTATTQVMGFINEAIGSALIGPDPRANAQPEETYPADAFMRVDEVPLMPPPNVAGKAAATAEEAGLSSIYNETQVDGSNAKAKLPPYQPYPYKVKPQSAQAGSPAVGPLDAESAQALELLLREQLPPTATPEQIQAQQQALAQAQALAQSQMKSQLARAMSANFAHMASQAAANVTAPAPQGVSASQGAAAARWPTIGAATVNMPIAGSNALANGAVVAPPRGMFKFDDSMMSQDGPRDGYMEMAMALPADEAAAAASISQEEAEPSSAMSTLFNQLTSVLSNVIGADKDDKEDKSDRDRKDREDRAKAEKAKTEQEQSQSKLDSEHNNVAELTAELTGVAVTPFAIKDGKEYVGSAMPENYAAAQGIGAMESEPSAEELEARAAAEAERAMAESIARAAQAAAEAKARADKAAADAAFARALAIASIGPRNPNLSVDDLLNDEERAAKQNSRDERQSELDKGAGETHAAAHGEEQGVTQEGESAAEVDNSDVTILSVDEVLAHEPTGEPAATTATATAATATAAIATEGTKTQDAEDLSLTAAVESQLQDIEAELLAYEQPPYQPLSEEFISVQEEARESIPFMRGFQDLDTSIIDSLYDLTVDPEHPPMSAEERMRAAALAEDNEDIELTVDDVMSLEDEARSLTFEDQTANGTAATAVHGVAPQLRAVSEVLPMPRASASAKANASATSTMSVGKQDEAESKTEKADSAEAIASIEPTEKSKSQPTSQNSPTISPEDTEEIELTVDDVLEVAAEQEASAAYSEAVAAATESTATATAKTAGVKAVAAALNSKADEKKGASALVESKPEPEPEEIELTVDDVLEVAAEQDASIADSAAVVATKSTAQNDAAEAEAAAIALNAKEATASTVAAAETAIAEEHETAINVNATAITTTTAIAANTAATAANTIAGTADVEQGGDVDANEGIELTVDDVLEVAAEQEASTADSEAVSVANDSIAIANATTKDAGAKATDAALSSKAAAKSEATASVESKSEPEEIELTVDDVLEVVEEQETETAKSEAAAIATAIEAGNNAAEIDADELSAKDTTESTVATAEAAIAGEHEIATTTTAATADAEQGGDADANEGIELTVDDVLEVEEEQKAAKTSDDIGLTVDDVFEGEEPITVAARTATSETASTVESELTVDTEDIELTVDDVFEVVAEQEAGADADNEAMSEASAEAVAAEPEDSIEARVNVKDAVSKHPTEPDVAAVADITKPEPEKSSAQIIAAAGHELNKDAAIEAAIDEKGSKAADEAEISLASLVEPESKEIELTVEDVLEDKEQGAGAVAENVPEATAKAADHEPSAKGADESTVAETEPRIAAVAADAVVTAEPEPEEIELTVEDVLEDKEQGAGAVAANAPETAAKAIGHEPSVENASESTAALSEPQSAAIAADAVVTEEPEPKEIELTVEDVLEGEEQGAGAVAENVPEATAKAVGHEPSAESATESSTALNEPHSAAVAADAVATVEPEPKEIELTVEDVLEGEEQGAGAATANAPEATVKAVGHETSAESATESSTALNEPHSAAVAADAVVTAEPEPEEIELTVEDVLEDGKQGAGAAVENAPDVAAKAAVNKLSAESAIESAATVSEPNATDGAEAVATVEPESEEIELTVEDVLEDKEQGVGAATANAPEATAKAAGHELNAESATESTAALSEPQAAMVADAVDDVVTEEPEPEEIELTVEDVLEDKEPEADLVVKAAPEETAKAAEVLGVKTAPAVIKSPLTEEIEPRVKGDVAVIESSQAASENEDAQLSAAALAPAAEAQSATSASAQKEISLTVDDVVTAKEVWKRG